MNTGIRFLSAGKYLPASTLTNQDIASRLNCTIRPAWVVDSLGIEKRQIAAPGELTSDLATKAVGSALRNAGVSPDSIDLLVLATSSPDMRAPEGWSINLSATLVRIEGRKLVFSVEGSDGQDTILRGTHVRAVVDRGRFLENLATKVASTTVGG